MKKREKIGFVAVMVGVFMAIGTLLRAERQYEEDDLDKNPPRFV